MSDDFNDPSRPYYETQGSGSSKILPIALAVITLGVVVYLLYPTVEDKLLLPQPEQAWVAIEVEGSGVARVGRMEVNAGTAFTLHAVLEAEGRGGPVYYTQAERLEISGEEVPAASLRRWDRSREPKIRWFSVEGSTPFLRVSSVKDVEDNLRFEELFRPDWPSAWSIPGRLEPMGGRGSEVPRLPFGTQRYHVRIEIYSDEDSLVPDQRYRSWGAEELPQRWQEFPGVTAHLPGSLRPASRAFGLAQIEPAPGLPAEVTDEILNHTVELNRRAVAFSYLGVVRRTIAASGREPGELPWQDLDLTTLPRWGEQVNAGDLLQAGDRIVLLHEDLGEPGVLDAEDFCIDFYRGASVRRLDQIFEGTGILSWVALSSPP